MLRTNRNSGFARRRLKQAPALPGILLLGACFGAVSAQAANVDIIDFPAITGDCASVLQITHQMSIEGLVADINGPDRDVVTLVLYDGEDNAFAYIGITVSVGFSATLPSQVWNYPFITQPLNRPFTLRVYDVTTEVTTASANIAGAQQGALLDVIEFDPVDASVCTSLPLAANPVPPPAPPTTAPSASSPATPVPALPLYGLVLTILGTLLAAARRL